MGLRYEYMDPLVDISYTNSNLTFNNGVPSAFIGGQNGFPKGLKYPNPHNFAPRFGISQALPQQGLVFHARVRHLLHAGGYEYVVQPAAQRSVRLSGDAAERQLHAIRSDPGEPTSTSVLRCWDRPR